MFRAFLFAALCGVLLPSCQSWCARSVPEDTPVMLSMSGAEYHLQLLPHGEGVRVQRATPAAAFVLKNNAYEVESRLRALMREGYTREDAAQSRADMGKTHPFVMYRIDGRDIYVSRRRFMRRSCVKPLCNPMYALGIICAHAVKREQETKSDK